MFDDTGGIIQALMKAQGSGGAGAGPSPPDPNAQNMSNPFGGLGSSLSTGLLPGMMGGGGGGLMSGGLMGMLGSPPPTGLMGMMGGGQSPQMNRPPQIGQSMPSGIADDPNKRPAVPTLNSQTSPF